MELVTRASESLAKAEEIEDADAVQVPPSHIVDRDQADNSQVDPLPFRSVRNLTCQIGEQAAGELFRDYR